MYFRGLSRAITGKGIIALGRGFDSNSDDEFVRFLRYALRSMLLYRETRQRARTLVQEVEQAGYDRVQIVGDAGNDLVDVCCLTYLE